MIVAALGDAPCPAAIADDRVPVFEHDVLPIMRAHCFKCHGFEGRKAGLDLRTVALMVRGSEHGPVLVKGDSATSRMFEKVSTRAMPPGDAKKLSDAQIQTIKEWIDGGARAAGRDGPATAAEAAPVTDQDRRFWSFRKPVRMDPPGVRQLDRVRTPIDSFVVAKLEPLGLALATDAERLTLMRRAYLDIIGLPPSHDEVDAYLADDAPNAYDRLLDRLLASPHFGERWGRHWLDVAGYADTLGSDNDAGIIRMADGKWRYRDYVVRSFNTDKPFDRFITEQLAGDELVDWRSAERFTPETLELLVATGFLRNAPDTTSEPELNTAVTRYQVLNDTIQIVTSSLLGLTVHCARCHSHKYDPIPQLDYYRLTAMFTPALNPQDWQAPPERALPDVSPAEKAVIEQHNAAIDRQVAELAKQLDELRRPYEAKLAAAKLDAIPEPIRADTKTAIDTPADKRNEIQKYLAGKFEVTLKVKPDEIAAALSDTDKAAATKIEQQIAMLNSQKRSFGRIQALVDVGPPPAMYLLRRGDYETPGPEVEPGFLNVLCTGATSVSSGEASGGAALGRPTDRPAVAPPSTAHDARRLELARWLTKPDSPAGGLVARVMVNRIWHHLFGQGIVATLDNFGKTGTPPTHPELLNWLAVEFIESGWRVKPLVKLIMTSTAYRQASHVADLRLPTGDSATSNRKSEIGNPQSLDPDNILLWRQRLRRLEAEALRDSILAVSGKLDRTIGGPPVPIEARPDGMVVIADKGLPSPTSPFRRSLYLLARRNYQPTFLSVFDQPVLATNCTRRSPSAVSLQSLTMLNDAFVLEQAEQFARRVDAAAGAEPDRRIEFAFQTALARKPTGAEKELTAALLRRQSERYLRQNSPAPRGNHDTLQALASLCQMLLNTSEFLYVQ